MTSLESDIVTRALVMPARYAASVNVGVVFVFIGLFNNGSYIASNKNDMASIR